MYTVRARPRGGGASTETGHRHREDPCGDEGREQRTQAPPGMGRSRDRSALGAPGQRENKVLVLKPSAWSFVAAH